MIPYNQKRNVEMNLKKTLVRTRTGNIFVGRLLPCLVVIWVVGCLGMSACQVGTGDVTLTLNPDEMKYTNVDVEFRQQYQLVARDTETNSVVGGYPVEISMSWGSGGCGGDVVSEFWTIENEQKRAVRCPWQTLTEDDGTVRFFVRFSGSTECGEWGYALTAFGEEGSFAISNASNTCEDES